MSVVKKTSGVALALAAATLMGCAAQSETKVASAEAQVHCAGVNKCAGHNDCKTAENACKGQAACKGHGFLAMSAEACGKVGGTITK
jgi:hypothetical protein